MRECDGSLVRSIEVCVLVTILLTTATGLAATTRANQPELRSHPSVAKSRVPAPRDVIGFTPGEDRKLASWSTIVDYFKQLERASDRVMFQELGKTTLGRPFVLATISSPRNLAKLERFKEIQRKLADPRTFNSNDAEAEKLIADGRTIVLITCGIHSTEVGGNLVSMNIAYQLASDDSPETREILDRCIILLVPSLNPDGVDIVKNWYDKTLGTPAEGTGPPELYHHYTGHDNNRDWYAFTQVETQLTVDKVHNVWHPQIVHDIHQQGETGTRFFLPPYVEPWEPNVPPIIQAGVNFMGSSMAWELIGEGKAGVVTNGVYDAWTPARAYQHYHGGIRILSETASAKIASPTTVPFDKLTPQVGVDPKIRSANFPLVWPGGEWKLANIVDYMQAGAFALLRNAARYRERWLRDFYRIGKDAVRERKEGEPFAFLMPPQKEPRFWQMEGRRRLLSILARGEVETIDADSAFDADGRLYPAGTQIVPMAQPYGAFAKTLLERQQYPDLREYPGGPPRRPYDVTAHTLPLLMGVGVIRIEKPFTLPKHSRDGWNGGHGGPPQQLRVGIYKSYSASMDEGWTRWVFDQYKNELAGLKLTYASVTDFDMHAGNLELRLVAKGTSAYSSKEQAEAAAKSLPAGGDAFTAQWEPVFCAEHPASAEGRLTGWLVVSKTPVVTGRDMRDSVANPSEFAQSEYLIDFSLTTDGALRLSEGTSKHVGDRLAIVLNHEVISAPVIRSQISDHGQIAGNFTKDAAEELARALGALRTRFDCIVIPAQGTQQIVKGLSTDRYPSEVAGGLGEAGVEALKKFIEDGGTVITLNEASQFAIDQLGVPVKNVLEGVSPKEFYCPGSILKIKFDTTSPITRGAPMLESSNDESIAWVEGSLAFETTSRDAQVIARFADANELLLSGWLLGGEKLAGKAAIVEVKRGKGRVVMFAFRPQYRGQSVATFPFLFNAIAGSATR
jgi:SecDF, P1 head subdomain/Zinc carboxypeptidase